MYKKKSIKTESINFLIQITGALLVCLALGLTSCNKNKNCTIALYEKNNFNFESWYNRNQEIKDINNRYNLGQINQEQRDQQINDIVDAKLNEYDYNIRKECQDL